MIDRLSTMPLLYQPGTRWVYSVSVDIQGYLVEKLSGKTFPEFLRTRLFEPLGMVDTAFYVPAEKLSRVATIYAYDKAKGGARAGSRRDAGITSLPGLASGGGGLYSTAADYFRFAQMLLNGGEYDGRRILKKATVDMMRTNVLSEQVLNSKSGIGQAQFSHGAGFWLRLRRRARSRCGKATGRQEQLLVVGYCRHLVLDRSDQRSDRHRHHSAPRWHAGRRESRRSVTQGRLRSTGASSLTLIKGGERKKKRRPPPGRRRSRFVRRTAARNCRGRSPSVRRRRRQLP